MSNEKSQFQKENDHLMMSLLEKTYFRMFRQPVNEQNDSFYLEMNITATCNQACEYCYLVKHGDKLYPKEIRKPSVILQNIRILLQYLVDNGMNPVRYDLFSGEIWGTKFGDQVYDVILEFLRAGTLSPKMIMIPSNCSFTYDKKLRDKIDWYIREFDKCGTRLVFSTSMDGLPVEEQSRPFRDKKKNTEKNKQENYDTLFKWNRTHDYAYHPMVSAHNVDKWIENYDWWMMMLDKYHLDKHVYIMTLEVRNDEWDDKSITHYLRFLDHMINVDFKDYYNSDKSAFVNDITGYKPLKNTCSGYFPYRLNLGGIQEDFQCTIKRSLIVRMGDLAIGPCHRTCYPEFIYGKFDVEDGKITGVTANNVQMMNRIYFLNTYSCIQCDRCPINDLCMKGCMGAQFEANSEPLYPCPTVCEFFKAKYIFLYAKFKKSFVSQYAKTENAYDDKFFTNFEKTIEKLKGDPLWNKWEPIARSIATEIR